MPYLNGCICSEVWVFEECIPNELWDRSVLIWFDSLLWGLENIAKIQYLPCIRSCIFWDVGMKSLARLCKDCKVCKDFCAWLPWQSSPLCLPGLTLEPGGGKNVEAVFYSALMESKDGNILVFSSMTCFNSVRVVTEKRGILKLFWGQLDLE